MGRSCFIAILLLVPILLPVAGRPVAASALSLNPDPIFFAFGSLRGEVDLIAFAYGVPEGATLLEGTVSPTDLTAILGVTLDAGSVSMGPLGVFAADLPAGTLVNPTGAGVLPGAGVDISGVTRLTAPGLGDSIDFGFVGGSLLGGQVADQVFVSYPALEIGDLFGVVVGIPPEPGQQFGRRDAVSGTLVPEPRAISLFVMGFAMLARMSASRVS